jgi:diguanylate cyclase (GGDEF)-like protein/PAS domain S-box-containing protein
MIGRFFGKLSLGHLAALGIGALVGGVCGGLFWRRQQAQNRTRSAQQAEALQSLEQERDQMRAILEGAAARVTEEQEQTQIILAALGQGLIGLDARGCVQLVNPTAERLLGWAEEELLGNPLHDYLHPPQGREPHCDTQDCPLLHALCGERSHRAEQDTFQGKEGRSLPVAYICTPVIRAGACAGALLVFDDITERLAAAAALDAYARQVAEQNAQLQTYCAELTEAQEELEAQARALAEANVRLEALAATDGKTGLANYSTFQECLRNAWAAVTEGEGAAPFSLLLFDVDYFKRYNDAYGHPEGDDLLRQLAQVLQERMRQGDMVARYGGEEFIALLANTDKEKAMQAAERLCKAIATHSFSGRFITVSIGVVTVDGSEATEKPFASPEAVIVAADRALYHAKNTGRNRACAYHSSMEEVEKAPKAA